MSAIEVGILVYHLRLKPQTEHQSHSVYIAYNVTQGATEFFLIDKPVTKACVVTVACAEPTVIEYKKVNAESFTRSCNIYNLFTVKIETRCLPIVNENGAAYFHILTNAGVITERIVK